MQQTNSRDANSELDLPSLCNLSVLSVSWVGNWAQTFLPLRLREHKGCTEKKCPRQVERNFERANRTGWN